MRSIALSLAVVAACRGGESPVGRELARLPGDANSLFVVGDELIAVVSDPELFNQWEAGKTTRDIVLAVPLAGGTSREIARPPRGELYASRRGMLYATTDGDLVLFDSGASRKLAQINVSGAAYPRLFAPAWGDGDSVLAIANDIDGDRAVSRVMRVSTQTGEVTGLSPPLKEITTEALVTVDDAGVYYTAPFSAETLHVSGNRVEKIAGPSEWVSCLAVGRDRLWWIQRKPASAPREKPDNEPVLFRIMWMPRAGGSVTQAGEFSGFNAGCASSGDDLIFFVDSTIMSIERAEPARAIVRARGRIGELTVEGRAVYWTEPVGSKTPVKEWSIRTLPLH